MKMYQVDASNRWMCRRNVLFHHHVQSKQLNNVALKLASTFRGILFGDNSLGSCKIWPEIKIISYTVHMHFSIFMAGKSGILAIGATFSEWVCSVFCRKENIVIFVSQSLVFLKPIWIEFSLTLWFWKWTRTDRTFLFCRGIFILHWIILRTFSSTKETSENLHV